MSEPLDAMAALLLLLPRFWSACHPAAQQVTSGNERRPSCCSPPPQVLPAICTEERITLGAELEDGTVVRGQNTISHPTVETSGGGEQ